MAITELKIIIPGPEIEADPEAVTLWDETGNFISAALAQMDRDKALSIILGRLQHALREAYGAENARKALQAIMDTMEPAEAETPTEGETPAAPTDSRPPSA